MSLPFFFVKFMSEITLYGTPISQPYRAVAWLMKIKGLPFKVIKVDPMSGQAEKPQYLAIAPTGLIPAIVDEGGYTLFESAAILTYLCEKNQWTDFLPLNASVRGRIHQYLHWHHFNLRLISAQVFRPVLMEKLMGRGKAPEKTPKGVLLALDVLERFFLKVPNQFVAGTPQASIADLLAYCEMDQLEVTGLLQEELSKMPNTQSWMKRMKALPMHEEVRQELNKLGARLRVGDAVGKAKL